MATMAALKERSSRLFTELLAAQAARPPARRRPGLAAAAAAPPGFSWFEPRDAVGAAALSFRLSALAASRKRTNDGLAAALDHVDEEARRADPDRVRQGLALFVTHNRAGRNLIKPRTVAAAPALFNPPRAGRGRGRASLSLGGKSPGLDYWREDALANEHHEHWHEVYPYTGIAPEDFAVWLTRTPQAAQIEILEAAAPGGQWATRVPSANPTALAAFFAQELRDAAFFDLEPRLYKLMFRLNDRQGELFFYMHQQMLARYDAELLSNDLARVEPFGPSQWTKPIEAGQKAGINGIGTRPPNTPLPAGSASALRALNAPATAALQSKTLRKTGGGSLAIDRTTLGEAIEATASQLSGLDPGAYPGLHNNGHGFIAALAKPQRGVMAYPLTAIRDQVFWQWHKFIDDINAKWQETLAPYDFADKPAVLLRDGLGAAAAKAWKSPDIILCRTRDIPAGAKPATLGKALFGGANWDTDFTAATAQGAGGTLTTISELTTSMAQVHFGAGSVSYLTHEPFSYFLRIENTAAAVARVTVRIFLAPASQAADRRAWMELDKFGVAVPAASRLVVYRPDTESSVIKRKAETSPARVLAGGGDPSETSYCDCGWPYTLLLPRGTTAGMEFRLLALCTDAAIDQLETPDHCGSMSYCGAVDRYPDARDMGYPFCRPFAGTRATAASKAILGLPSAAARTVTIRHSGP